MFKIFMADVFINLFKNIIINDLNSLTNIKIAEILKRKISGTGTHKSNKGIIAFKERGKEQQKRMSLNHLSL